MFRGRGRTQVTPYAAETAGSCRRWAVRDEFDKVVPRLRGCDDIDPRCNLTRRGDVVTTWAVTNTSRWPPIGSSAIMG